MSLMTADLKRLVWRSVAAMPFPIGFTVITARDQRRSRKRVQALLDAGTGRSMEDFRAALNRSSDTVFILGSGASINSLTKSQWRSIERADSFGLNFWPIHEFVPTCYVFEEPRDPERSEALYAILQSKADAYRHVPIIAKTADKLNLERFPSVLRPNLVLSANVALPVNDEASLRRALVHMRDRGSLEGLEALRVIPFKRASITYLIFLGLFLGYRKIVLCGVDLRDTGYFYDQHRSRYQAAGLPVPITGQTGTVHRTFDRGVGELTVDRIVYAIDELVLRPAGVQLRVAHESSALHPRVPGYFDSRER